MKIKSLPVMIGAPLTLSLMMLNLLAGASESADWPTYGGDVQRTGYNPNENSINTNNVGNLHEQWTFDLGAVTNSQPVYASNVNVNGTPTNIVYTGSENGYFYALNASTGQKIWSQYLGAQKTKCTDLPNQTFGVSSTAALDRTTNRIYVAGGDGKVYALNMSNGAIVPGWPVKIVEPSLLHVYGAINIYNGNLYAVAASYCDSENYHGGAFEVNIATARLTKSFLPTGQSKGGGIWGTAGASIDPNYAGNVYVATGNGFPETVGLADSVVRLDSSLNLISSNHPSALPNTGDFDFGATPLLFKASSCSKSLLAAENKAGLLFLYDRYNIQNGPLYWLQMAQKIGDGQFIGIPAFSPITNMVYVSNTSSNGNYKQGMVALRVASNCTLQLAWQQPEGSPSTKGNAAFSPPTVANGIVYGGNGFGSQVFAFDASTGTKLWSSPKFSGPIFAAPTVIDGKLFVGSWDHKLHAFGISSNPAPSGTYLTPGQTLLPGQSISYGLFTLIMGTDGNLVLTQRAPYNGQYYAIWASGTPGHPGSFLAMQGDGNLVIYTPNYTPIWNTHTPGHAGSYFVLPANGNMYIQDNSNVYWASGTASDPNGHDKLFPGQKLIGQQNPVYLSSPNGIRALTLYSKGSLYLLAANNGIPLPQLAATWSVGTNENNPGSCLVMQTDSNLVLYRNTCYSGSVIWASYTKGNSSYGAYLQVQDDGNVVIYSNWHVALWSSNTAGK